MKLDERFEAKFEAAWAWVVKHKEPVVFVVCATALALGALFALLSFAGCSRGGHQPADVAVVADAAPRDLADAGAPRDLPEPDQGPRPSWELGLPVDLGSGLPSCGPIRGPLVLCKNQNGKPAVAPDGLVCFECPVTVPCELAYAGWDSVCLQSCSVCRYLL